jgi:hypothetical protein
MNEPQPFPAATGAEPKKGLSITSLVLGILSVGCCFLLTGIPAIITGHIAHGKAKKEPHVYGGAGLALAGLILGYFSIFTTLVLLPALLLPALARAKSRAQMIACSNNMKQIGLAARMYASDHNDSFPPDFRAMSNELNTPKVLVCPADKDKTKAPDFTQFDASQNVTYEYLTPNAKAGDVLNQIAFRCPIHGNTGLGDGSVQQNVRRR